MVFELDSGLLQQYGRPPTVDRGKGAFGSFLEGGLRGYQYGAERKDKREAAQLERDKFTSQDKYRDASTKIAQDTEARGRDQENRLKQQADDDEARAKKDDARKDAQDALDKKNADTLAKDKAVARQVTALRLKIAEDEFDSTEKLKESAVVEGEIARNLPPGATKEDRLAAYRADPRVHHSTILSLFKEVEAATSSPKKVYQLKSQQMTAAFTEYSVGNEAGGLVFLAASMGRAEKEIIKVDYNHGERGVVEDDWMRVWIQLEGQPEQTRDVYYGETMGKNPDLQSEVALAGRRIAAKGQMDLEASRQSFKEVHSAWKAGVDIRLKAAAPYTPTEDERIAAGQRLRQIVTDDVYARMEKQGNILNDMYTVVQDARNYVVVDKLLPSSALDRALRHRVHGLIFKSASFIGEDAYAPREDTTSEVSTPVVEPSGAAAAGRTANPQTRGYGAAPLDGQATKPAEEQEVIVKKVNAPDGTIKNWISFDGGKTGQIVEPNE